MHSWIKAISGAIVAQRGPGRSANTVGVIFTKVSHVLVCQYQNTDGQTANLMTYP